MISDLSLIYLILSIILMIISGFVIKHGLNLTLNLMNKGIHIDPYTNERSEMWILLGSLSFGLFGGLISNILAIDAMK